MKLRLRLIYLVLKRSTFLSILPIFVAYCFLPCLTIAKFLSIGSFEALRVFVYASQILFPLCGIFWNMGYLHIWIEGDTYETLCAYSTYHKSCIGEVIILSIIYLLMLLPTILLAVVLINASWLEYVRLAIQIFFIIGFFYFTAMTFQNVTIGCIPVIAYLFLCFCICGSAEFSVYSIFEPQHAAEQHNWNTLFALLPVSVTTYVVGYLCDRFCRRF